MKWLFIVFLLANVCYFGWELDRQTRIEVSNSVRPFNVPADVQRLELLGEMMESSDPVTSSEGVDEIWKGGRDEFSDVEDSPLQNIASMMDQGNVMIEKKVLDELAPSLPDFSTNNQPFDDKNKCQPGQHIMHDILSLVVTTSAPEQNGPNGPFYLQL